MENGGTSRKVLKSKNKGERSNQQLDCGRFLIFVKIISYAVFKAALGFIGNEYKSIYQIPISIETVK